MGKVTGGWLKNNEWMQVIIKEERVVMIKRSEIYVL